MLVLYIAAIVVPTLTVLVIGLQAVRREHLAFEELAAADRHRWETAVANAVEDRVNQQVASCLRDPRLAPVIDVADWDTPEAVGDTRRTFNSVTRDHHIAMGLFVVQSGRVVVPRVAGAFPEPVEARLAREALTDAGRVADQFRRAEALEFDGRAAEALAVYQGILAGARSETVRALALVGGARCALHLARQDEAARMYGQVAAGCRTAYDLAGRPQALVAGLELVGLRPRGDASTGRLLAGLLADLSAGRWDVAADYADYFLESAGLRAEPLARSPYLEYLRLASALSRHLATHRLEEDGRPHDEPLSTPDGSRHLFYLARSSEKRPGIVLAVVVADDVVRETVLPEVAQGLGLGPRVHMVPAGSGGTRFRSVFLESEVAVAPAGPAATGGASAPGTWLFAAVTLLVLGVLVIGVVLLMRDVARQTATSQLRADLVGGVSHDLKTPLSVIRMYGEMLGSDHEADHERRQLYSNVIIQESERLNRLIERVLDFSRVDRGLDEHRLQTAALAPIVRGVVERYRPYLDQQSFTADVEIACDLPNVRCDEAGVSQALLNLIDNAVKYSDDDRHLAVRLRGQGREVVLEVEDRGPGIPPAERARIFTRFYRSARDKGRGGYGLGLYLVRHMMDVHGGRVELESAPGRGSLFRLVFPAALPDTATSGAAGVQHGEDPGD